MPQGLQTYDASGNLIYDVDQRTGRLFGMRQILASDGLTITVTDARFDSAPPFAFVLNIMPLQSFGSYVPRWGLGTYNSSTKTYSFTRPSAGSFESTMASNILGTLVWGTK